MTSGALGAVLLGEQHIIGLVRVERRVEVDQVYRFVGDVPPKDVQIIAIVKDVVGRGVCSVTLRRVTSASLIPQ